MACKYTQSQLDFIKANCTLPADKLAALFNKQFKQDKTSQQLTSLRKRHGWKTGRTGRFEKGHTPSPLARPKGPNSASWKKGHRPHNMKPVGSKKYDTKNQYEWVKIADPDVWKMSHHLLFETHCGRKVKTGCLLRFKDGDKTNIVIDNIEEITLSENARLNQMHYKESPDALKPSIKLLAKVMARSGKMNEL